MEKGPPTHGSGMHDNASKCPHAKASEYQEDSYQGSKYLIVLPTNPSPFALIIMLLVFPLQKAFNSRLILLSGVHDLALDRFGGEKEISPSQEVLSYDKWGTK